MQLEKELALIARLKFSGYFLIVWEICAWARANNILVNSSRYMRESDVLCKRFAHLDRHVNVFIAVCCARIRSIRLFIMLLLIFWKII